MREFIQKNKLLSVVLIVSLALNAFLVSQAIGHHTRQRMMMGRLTQSQIERLVQYAPEKKREKLQKTLERNVQDIQGDLEAIRLERQNLANLMMAEKFNEDAIQRQFALLRIRMNYLQKHLQLLTMNMLRELSPEERMKAVRQMQPQRLWQPKGTKKDDAKDGAKKLDAKKTT
ncbi:MAG TPA: periplasmic heavy metal sensor [Alphaproteobacteria bacterium]